MISDEKRNFARVQGIDFGLTKLVHPYWETCRRARKALWNFCWEVLENMEMKGFKY